MRNLCILIPIMVLCGSKSGAQPSNDDCSNAIEVSSGIYQVDLHDASYSGLCDIDCMLSLDFGNLCAYDVWYKFSALDSVIVFFHSTHLAYHELYSGDCESLELLYCGPPSSFRKVPSGDYFLKISGNNQTTLSLTLEICPDIHIDPIMDVTACESYTLLPITGKNLSGNQAYFTGSQGTGSKYLPGNVITSSTTLYVYDKYGSLPVCAESEVFTIDIDEGTSYQVQLGGEWSDFYTWLNFHPPQPCDDVLLTDNYVLFIDWYYTYMATCKTLQVDLGSQFVVYLGAQLQVGN